jgi:hypothetical protein
VCVRECLRGSAVAAARGGPGLVAASCELRAASWIEVFARAIRTGQLSR